MMSTPYYKQTAEVLGNYYSMAAPMATAGSAKIRDSSKKILEDAKASGETAYADVVRMGEQILEKSKNYPALQHLAKIVQDTLRSYIEERKVISEKRDQEKGEEEKKSLERMRHMLDEQVISSLTILQELLTNYVLQPNQKSNDSSPSAAEGNDSRTSAAATSTPDDVPSRPSPSTPSAAVPPRPSSATPSAAAPSRSSAAATNAPFAAAPSAATTAEKTSNGKTYKTSIKL